VDDQDGRDEPQALTNLDRMIAKLEADEDDDPQPPRQGRRRSRRSMTIPHAARRKDPTGWNQCERQ
jgi:hypothetical protein